ncbi:MAG: hypothetical protein WCL29_05395 [Pseudomonadota bacterium]
MLTQTLKVTKTLSSKAQLDSFIDKFTPEVAKQIRFLFARMKHRWPTAQILVYDNYNFFVIGFAPSERPSEAIFSLAASANHVTLCFLQATRIPKTLDPKKLLKGSGNLVRHIRLIPATLIDDPDVRALMEAANAHAKLPFTDSGKSQLIIKSISAKRRSRQPLPKGPKNDR